MGRQKILDDWADPPITGPAILAEPSLMVPDFHFGAALNPRSDPKDAPQFSSS
jgi:hypothetical protein